MHQRVMKPRFDRPQRRQVRNLTRLLAQPLKHLMRQIPGKLLVIWDGSPIHRGGAVEDFLASGAARRLQLERLPGYAPDLNPDEGIWKHLKCVELKNLCCQSLAELRFELRKAKERLRHKRDVILGCIRQPGFEVKMSELRSVDRPRCHKRLGNLHRR